MDIQALINDIDTLCENEAATANTETLAHVRGVLEKLGSYVAQREQAIEARSSGHIEDAMGIEDRAEWAIQQLAIDAEAAFPDWSDVA